MDDKVTHDNITGLQASQRERLDEDDAFVDRDKDAREHEANQLKINNTAGDQSLDTDAKMLEIQKLIDNRKGGGTSSGIPSNSGLQMSGMDENLSTWQSADSWFWVNQHAVFQKQCRKVTGKMVGQEKFLIFMRIFWLAVFTFEICVSTYGLGGAIYNSFPFVSKWALWLTYFSQIVGLFSTDLPSDESKSLQTSYKYSPFFAWKWYTILFQMAVTFEIFAFITYWIFLHADSWHSTTFKDRNFTERFSLVADHSLPLLCLIIEYCMTQMVFMKRHVMILAFIATFYLIINLSYSLAYRAPYSWTDWHSVGGVFLHLGLFLIFILEFYLIEWLNRKKLLAHGDNEVMVAILSDQGITNLFKRKDKQRVLSEDNPLDD